MSRQLTLKVKRAVAERATPENMNIPVCEARGCNAIHDLQYHHSPNKKMGGSKKRYSEDNVKLLCPKCHLIDVHRKGGV